MPEVLGVLDPCVALKHFLEDYFAGIDVPEGHYVEPVDCCENVTLLLPYKVVFRISLTLKLYHSAKKIFLNDRDQTMSEEKLEILLLERQNFTAVLAKLDDLVRSDAFAEKAHVDCHEVLLGVESE